VRETAFFFGKTVKRLNIFGGGRGGNVEKWGKAKNRRALCGLDPVMFPEKKEED